MAYNYDELKTPPTYDNPTQTNALLQQFLSKIGQGGFGGAIADAQGVVGRPGGASGIAPMLKNLGAFVGKGGKAADAYIRQGLQSTRKAGMEGMNILRGQQGQAGGLGSTMAGMSDVSLMSETLGQANQVRATGEQMRESNKMGRLGLGIQGLSNMGDLMQREKTGNMMATQNIAQMIGNQDQAGQSQLMQALMAQFGIEQAPGQHEMDVWSTIMGKPKSPSTLDYVLGGLGSLASGGYL